MARKTKKKASKKVAKRGAKKDLISMADLQRQLAGEAEELAEQEPTYGGLNISTRNKTFSIGETDLGDEIRVIIVAHSFVNAYWDVDFDPKGQNTAPPACFAISETPDSMAPMKESPAAQAEFCQECQWDQFGTAKIGAGKACRNMRRLVVMMADDNSDDPQLAQLHIPPSGIVAYTKYVRGLAKIHKLPPHGVVTDMSFNEDSQQPVAEAALVSPISDPQLLQMVMTKRKEAMELAAQPFNTSGYEAPSKRQTKKKTKKKAKKKAAKKRGRRTKY